MTFSYSKEQESSYQISHTYEQDMNTNVRVSMNRINDALRSKDTLTDMSRIENEIRAVRSSLQHVSKSMDSTVGSNHRDMNDLERLDTVRKNMLRCKTRLEGAAEWSRQVRHVQQVLDSSNTTSDLDSLTEDFKSLQKLEILLREMPAASEREEMKEKLMKRLRKEILLPCLETRIEGKNIQSLIRAFREMGLSRMARDSYVEKRSDIFAQIWKSAQKDDQDMAIWLPETYDRISRLLTEESRRLSDLFFSEDEEEEEENNDSAYHQLCVRFFDKISQDFETRLREILKRDVKTCVVNFTRLFGLTREFSTSRFDDDVIVQDAILKPYRHFQKRYGELETEHLTSCLENLNLDRRMMTNKIDHADASMIALEALSSLFLRFETAIERCVQFTNAIETSSLFNAIEMTLTEFVSTLKGFVEKVRSQKPVEKVKKKIAQDVDDLFDVGGDEEKETSPSSSGNGIMGAVQLVLVSFRL